MKTLMSLFILLIISLSVTAEEHKGFVQRLIPDDHGIKIIISDTATVQDSYQVKTVYLQNTQSNFKQIEHLASESQKSKTQISIAKDNLKNLTITRQRH